MNGRKCKMNWKPGCKYVGSGWVHIIWVVMEKDMETNLDLKS